MLGTRLLLITANPRIRQQVLRALNSTGCDVDQVETLDAADQRLAVFQPRIILVDVDGVSSDVSTFLATQAQRAPSTPILLLSQHESKEALIELLGRQNLNNLIAKHGAINASEELVDEHELIVTCEKLLRRDI